MTGESQILQILDGNNTFDTVYIWSNISDSIIILQSVRHVRDFLIFSLLLIFPFSHFSRTATPQKRCHSNGSILFFQRTMKLHRSHAEKTSPSAAPTVDGSEIRRSPVEGKVVYHPIYLYNSGFRAIQTVVGIGISEPSTVSDIHPCPILFWDTAISIFVKAIPQLLQLLLRPWLNLKVCSPCFWVWNVSTWLGKYPNRCSHCLCNSWSISNAWICYWARYRVCLNFKKRSMHKIKQKSNGKNTGWPNNDRSICEKKAQKSCQYTAACTTTGIHIGVSKNRCSPKSSILIRFSLINHPFGGTPIFGNIHMEVRYWVITSGETWQVLISQRPWIGTQKPMQLGW